MRSAAGLTASFTGSGLTRFGLSVWMTQLLDPAMAEGGVLAPSLGPWIGVGEGPGAARLLLVGVDLGIMLFMLASATSSRIRRLEDALIEAQVGSDE